MKGRFPAVVIHLKLPFEEVDVNVHPSKIEVRFRRQAEIHDVVAAAVRDALKQEAKKPAPQLSVKATPSYEIRDAPLPYSGAAARWSGHERFQPLAPDFVGHPPQPDKAGGGFFSSLEILGQLLGCYIVCAAPGGMVLIDQHAAHERVAFEKMRRQLAAGEVEKQNLLIPQILELPIADAMLLEQRLPFLLPLGFEVDLFGANSFAVKAVPAFLPPGDYREVVKNMIAEFAEVGHSAELRHNLEERLATIACHSVVRANRRLDREEIRALFYELDQIDFATQCPHGRPVVLEFTREELERMFKRA